jgi:protoporphyrinogen oxidase
VGGRREGSGESGVNRVGIVGGGIMGITLAYLLARAGIRCEVFEGSPSIGGLAGSLILEDGTAVDRYYHTILSSDSQLRELCGELGVLDQLKFRNTRNTFYVDGGLHSMNSLLEFLTFRPLPPLERFRLGLTVARAQFYKDWRELESVTLRDWLTRLGGARVFERLWAPMLEAKFGGDYSEVPATWMWSRLVRMKSTREGANQRERAGHLVGGYATLLSAMQAFVERNGGTIHTNCPVDKVVIAGETVTGVRVRGAHVPFSRVVITMQGPVSARLVPDAPAHLRARLVDVPYLGVVCALMVLDRPLSGSWTVNIADRSIPLTAVVETTSYIDPADVGGHHLVYLPKYTAPGSPWLTVGDDEIKATWFEALRRMFPGFSESWVRYFLINRERYVEPIRRIGSTDLPGWSTGIDGLHFASTAHIYPALSNGEAVTRHASAVVRALVHAQTSPKTGPSVPVDVWTASATAGELNATTR